jgi:hypothetical protein
MTPGPAVLPPPSWHIRREELWSCAGFHHTLDATSPGFPGQLAPRLPSARRPRQNRSWRRPSAILGERSPEDVRSLDRRNHAATGHAGVSTNARFPPGSSYLDDRGPTLPRADSGRMPFVDPIRGASSPTPLPTSDSPGSPSPSAAARTRDKLEAAMPSSSLRSPPTAPSPTRGSRPTPEEMLRPQIRLGSRTTLTTLWKPRMPRNTPVPDACRSEHHRGGANADTAGTRMPDHQAPKGLPRTRRPRTRDAIRAARALSQRFEGRRCRHRR